MTWLRLGRGRQRVGVRRQREGKDGYKNSVWPELEYANVLWSPMLEMDENEMGWMRKTSCKDDC